MESKNLVGLRRSWTRLSTVDPRVVLWLARPVHGYVVLTTDPAGLPKATIPRVGIRLIPKPRPMPNELISSREHNWLTSKVLLTAGRAHAIRTVTLRTGQ
jgi:hypothetical protein